MQKNMKLLCLFGNRHRKILRIMRITLFILLFGTFQVIAGAGYSQNARLSLHLRGASVKEVLGAIEAQSEYYFLYNSELIDVQRKVDLNVENETIEQILSALFQEEEVKVVVRDRHIILTPTERTVRQQSKPVSGTIRSASGEPLPGVTILIKGTSVGTITDTDGNFSLSKVSPDAILVISFIGMRTQEIGIGDKSVFNMTMDEENIDIEEVVAVGYGVQKKVNLTGAVDVVKGEALENRAITSVASGLQGLLPGLTITSSSGQPGNPQTSILVRGVNTINSSTSPLVLIDGITGGDIDLLNPDDIESVSVLKDAASAAIYGARAATGVILITTKQGSKSEQVSVNYSGYVGVQTPTRLPEMVSGREYMTLLNEALSNAGLAEVYSDEAFEKYDSKNYPNDYSNTDWLDEVYKKYAAQTSHNLNVSGGTAKSGYYMSYGYLDQDGLIVGDPYQSDRHNVRLRINTDLSKRLKVDGNLSYISFYKRDAAASGTAGVFRLSQRISPLLPVMWQQQDDNGEWSDTEYYSYGSVSNPVNVAKNSGYSKLNSKIASGAFNAEFKVLEGLVLKGQYTFNHEGNDTKRYNAIVKKYKSDGSEDAGNSTLESSASESYYSYLSQGLNSTLNFDRKSGKHAFSVLLGASREWGYNNWITASRDNILDGIEVVSGGTENYDNSASGVEWAMLSYFGRLNYNFAEKYLFEANIRHDGTSRFSKTNDNRWGTFPSFSAGWKFSEENFMAVMKSWLTMGKIRASWGELGNQNVGDYYPYLTSLQLIDHSYPIGGAQFGGIYQPTLNNPNIKWETLVMLNIGVDLQLFANRLGLSADWFKKNNRDAILKPIYPTSLGTSSTADLPYVNMGEIENKGWELSVNWNDRIGEVKYRAQFNISDSKNKVLDLGESQPYLGSDAYRKEDDPLNAYYGYATGGLFQPDDFEYKDESTGVYTNPSVPTLSDLAQPGDIKYLDISGENGEPDGVIDSYDKRIMGERYPRYSYSFKGDLAWKGLDLSFYLQGVGKVNGYLSDEARHAFINDYSVPQTAHLDRWTPNNQGATYPRLYYAQTHNLEVSDYWVEDASYLRLKNIQVGYTLPKKITGKMSVNRVRLYLSADNLFTITNYYEAYDPEIRSSSGDSYPQVKTYIFGVNVSF